jgi:hypothetical protein
MNKNQDKEILKDPADSPQIRFSIRGTKTAIEQAADQDDIKKLSKIVEQAFGTIAKAGGISEKEVLHLIGDIHVDMLKDVLKEDKNADVLRESIQEAIKSISLATDLDTEQITDIFSANRDANLNDTVIQLHDRTQTNRDKFGGAHA